MNDTGPWPATGDDMADKDRAQGKSKKAMTKKAKQKKKTVERKEKMPEN